MMYYKYSKEDEEAVLHVAKEINKTLPKVFSEEREILTLDYLLRLILACQHVLEENNLSVAKVNRHSYRCTDYAKEISAISVLVSETILAAKNTGYIFRQLNGEYINYTIREDWLNEESAAINAGINECKKSRKAKPRSPFAVFEKDRQKTAYLCLCGQGESEDLFLLSKIKLLKLNEYEFYSSDADRSKKKLEKYFTSIAL